MSKREQKDLRRLHREEAQFRARRKRFRQNLAVIGGSVLVALVVLALVALSIHNRRGGSPTPSTSTSPSTTGTATVPPTGAATAPATIPSAAATAPIASGSPAR